MAVELLVTAGEASGDRAAAGVVRELAREAPHVRVIGLGGAALSAAGATLLADLRQTTAMGLGAVAARSLAIASAHRVLLRAAHRRSVRAALLVNYTEFNARLAPRLHARGVRVLWYGAPQVWAWRKQRTESVRPGIDRMAVILPFEEPLWRERGVDAHYVGHPASECDALPREGARDLLGLTQRSAAIAILPGSRPHEVRRLLPLMLAAYQRVRSDRASIDGRVLIASSLDDDTRGWVISRAREARVGVFDVDPQLGAGRVLRAFDATLCASGTASLEAVLARAIPVVAYRVGLVTELLARALLLSPHIALPNVLLGRRAFAELLQRDATTRALTRALRAAVDRRRELVLACDEVEAILGNRRTPSREVARLLRPWLREASLLPPPFAPRSFQVPDVPE
jgi:lipid-A-disaccharide synthase